tara:strand:+ start:995 stop:1816 length:822 start_codon:yes stop_codon:yes gene_type:complete
VDGKKLKKISDNEFEALEDGKIFKESIGSFHLPLRNLEIINYSQVHECDIDIFSEKPALSSMKTKLDESQILLGTVDKFQDKRSIFYCRTDENDKEIISAHASFEDMTVRLTAGVPTKDQKIPDGLYHGSMYYIESDPYDVYPSNLEQDRFNFNLSIPKQHFDSLIVALRTDPKATLQIGVHVCTFRGDGYNEIHLIPSYGAHTFVDQAAVKSKHGLHIYDVHNPISEEIPYQHTSLEQITSEKILAQLQSNNRWLSAIAIMVTAAFVSTFFW